jgi:serine O-acetyltransferase
MDDEYRKQEHTCKIDAESRAGFRELLPEKADKIIESCNDKECYTHVDYELIPSQESVIEIIQRCR